MKVKRYMDIASIVVIIVTLILFVFAFYVKGLTHDILLEAAVFLISAKLILQTYKNGRQTKYLEEQLEKNLEKQLGDIINLEEQLERNLEKQLEEIKNLLKSKN